MYYMTNAYVFDILGKREGNCNVATTITIMVHR